MAVALVEPVYAGVLSQGGDVVMSNHTVFEDPTRKDRRPALVAPDPVCLDRIQEMAA